MDVREAIYGRRAVREFTTELVEEAALRRLVDAAIQAPSAVNQQPWLFTIVRGKELLARVSNEAKAHMLRTSPAALASHHFLHILNDPNLDIFYGAPVLVVISAAGGPWAVENCSLAAEPDARSARSRARHVLDRVCARLARNARRQVGPEVTRHRYPGCSHYSRASEVRSSPGFEETLKD
jgi:nitroreductase